MWRILKKYQSKFIPRKILVNTRLPRIRVFTLIFILSASLGSNLLLSNPTFAQESVPKYQTLDIEKRLRAWGDYTAVNYCVSQMAKDIKGNIADQNAGYAYGPMSGYWFGGGKDATNEDPSHGKHTAVIPAKAAQASDITTHMPWTSAAIPVLGGPVEVYRVVRCSTVLERSLSDSWGITPAAFLEGIGYTVHNNGTEWKCGDRCDGRSGRVWRVVADHDATKGGSGLKYAAYLRSFEKLCSAAKVPLPVNDSIKNAARDRTKISEQVSSALFLSVDVNSYYIAIKGLDTSSGTPTITDTYYSYVSGSSASTGAEYPIKATLAGERGTGTGGISVVENCDEIAEYLNGNESGASAYLEEKILDACRAAGIRIASIGETKEHWSGVNNDDFDINDPGTWIPTIDTAIKNTIGAACFDGAKNPADPEYCKKYTDPAEADACRKGQGAEIKEDTPATDTSGGTDDNASTCTIEGVGWILCPILTAGANLADSAFGFIAGSFLEVSPDLLGDGTRTAWSVMQGFANAGFIIIFIMIVYSQLTQMGISVYGVKKMLPRLIIAAILVNMSFFLTQLAVDLSNIIGYGAKNMLGGIAQTIQASTGGTGVVSGADTTSFAGIVTTVIAASVATAALFWLNLGAVIVAVVVALITLLTIFVILALRKALIVLLVAIAPIAIVAYVLPNTKKLFDSWLKIFTSLLMVFPIIGLLYGGSLLAHTILWNASGGDTIMQIVAYVVLVVPLIATIPLLKGSINAVGNIGGYINAMGAKLKGGAEKGARSGFERSRAGQFQKHRQNAALKRRASIQAGTYSGRGGKFNPRNWASGANAGINKMSGRFGADMATRGAAIAAKEDAELLQNSTSRLSSMAGNTDPATGRAKPLNSNQIMQMATTGAVTINGKTAKVDEHMQRSAIQRAVQTATVSDAQDLIAASSSMSDAARKTLSSSLAGSSIPSKAPHLGGKTLGDIEQGTANVAKAAVEAVKKGKFTAEALASSDATTINTIKSSIEAISDTGERNKLIESVTASYKSMTDNKELSAKVASGGDHDIALQALDSLRSLLPKKENTN